MIRIPKENREEFVQSLQDYFYNELSEEIGNLAAENLLDLVDTGKNVNRAGKEIPFHRKMITTFLDQSKTCRTVPIFPPIFPTVPLILPFFSSR